jgi:hypothetical protein
MLPQDKPDGKTNFSCTFCGPGTWASWDVVTEDGVLFVCDRHHVEMSEAKIIRLERRMGEKRWKQIKEYDEFKDVIDYE